MSPDNAKIITNTITVFLLGYCLLVFMDKIPIKKKLDFIEKNKRLFIVCTLIAMLYPVFEIVNVLWLKK
jgi:hypothetical protein